jgi:hypothetical protein
MCRVATPASGGGKQLFSTISALCKAVPDIWGKGGGGAGCEVPQRRARETVSGGTVAGTVCLPCFASPNLIWPRAFRTVVSIVCTQHRTQRMPRRNGPSRYNSNKRIFLPFIECVGYRFELSSPIHQIRLFATVCRHICVGTTFPSNQPTDVTHVCRLPPFLFSLASICSRCGRVFAGCNTSCKAASSNTRLILGPSSNAAANHT